MSSSSSSLVSISFGLVNLGFVLGTVDEEVFLINLQHFSEVDIATRLECRYNAHAGFIRQSDLAEFEMLDSKLASWLEYTLNPKMAQCYCGPWLCPAGSEYDHPLFG